MPSFVDGVIFDPLDADPVAPEEGERWYRGDTKQHRKYRNGQIETDVAIIGSPVDGDHLCWNAAASKWMPTTVKGEYVSALKASAGTIVAGQLVYAAGWDGTNILVELARANSGTSMPSIGVAIDSITDAAPGHVCASGLVTGVNTAGMSVNDELYVSETTAGAFRAGEPSGPNKMQYVGVVLSVGASGTILVATPSDPDPWSDTVPTAIGTGVAAMAGTGYNGARYDHAHAVSLASSEVTVATSTTTTSTTDTLLGSMTLTPGAGTYLALFSASVASSSSSGYVYASLYKNGAQVSGSERQSKNVSSSSLYFPIAMQAIVTVADAQAIEVRWRTSAPTATCMSRTLTLVKIG
jgi:hypothetical protein